MISAGVVTAIGVLREQIEEAEMLSKLPQDVRDNYIKRKREKELHNAKLRAYERIGRNDCSSSFAKGLIIGGILF